MKSSTICLRWAMQRPLSYAVGSLHLPSAAVRLRRSLPPLTSSPSLCGSADRTRRFCRTSPSSLNAVAMTGDALAAQVLAQVPAAAASTVTLTALARALPDAVMEAVADRGGLRRFLEAHPSLFDVRRRKGSGGGSPAYTVRRRVVPPSASSLPVRAVSAAIGTASPLHALLPCINAERAFDVAALGQVYLHLAASSRGDRLGVAELLASDIVLAATRTPTAAPDSQIGDKAVVSLHAIIECLSRTSSNHENAVTEAFLVTPVAPSTATAAAVKDLVAGVLARPHEYADMDAAQLAQLPVTIPKLEPAVSAGGGTGCDSRRFRFSLYASLSSPSMSAARGAEASNKASADQNGEAAFIALPRLPHAPLLQLGIAARLRRLVGPGSEGEGGGPPAEEVEAGPSASTWETFAEDFTQLDAGCVPDYDVFRLARAMPVGDPVDLPTLSGEAAQLAILPLGRLLALWMLHEQGEGAPKPGSRGPPLLSAFAATPGPPGGVAAAGMGQWVTAVSFALDRAAFVPVEAGLSSLEDLKNALTQAKANYTAIQKQMVRQRTKEYNNRTRLNAFTRKRHLCRCIAVAEGGATTLLHPDVLAYALYDLLPQLPEEAANAPAASAADGRQHAGIEDAIKSAVVIREQHLRGLLPGHLSGMVTMPSKWARRYPHLFHVEHIPGGRWGLVRRDVHEELLRRASATTGEAALYNSNAALSEEGEIRELVISIVTTLLQNPKGCVLVDGSARAVDVSTLGAYIPKPVRQRIRRLVKSRDGPQHEGSAAASRSYMHKYCLLYPDTFVVVSVPHHNRQEELLAVFVTPQYSSPA